MKKIAIEALFILIISLIISLIYSATSTTGIILLKKAFKIKAETKSVIKVSDADRFRKILPRHT